MLTSFPSVSSYACSGNTNSKIDYDLHLHLRGGGWHRGGGSRDVRQSTQVLLGRLSIGTPVLVQLPLHDELLLPLRHRAQSPPTGQVGGFRIVVLRGYNVQMVVRDVQGSKLSFRVKCLSIRS